MANVSGMVAGVRLSMFRPATNTPPGPRCPGRLEQELLALAERYSREASDARIAAAECKQWARELRRQRRMAVVPGGEP